MRCRSETAPGPSSSRGTEPPSAATLARFQGTEVDTAGDGFFATFDGPARAILCATEIVSGSRSFGLSVRAGVHTGECEVSGEKVAGVAVHIGARVAGAGGTG